VQGHRSVAVAVSPPSRATHARSTTRLFSPRRTDEQRASSITNSTVRITVLILSPTGRIYCRPSPHAHPSFSPPPLSLYTQTGDRECLAANLFLAPHRSPLPPAPGAASKAVQIRRAGNAVAPRDGMGNGSCQCTTRVYLYSMFIASSLHSFLPSTNLILLHSPATLLPGPPPGPSNPPRVSTFRPQISPAFSPRVVSPRSPGM
jgi:hypothetical protein